MNIFRPDMDADDALCIVECIAFKTLYDIGMGNPDKNGLTTEEMLFDVQQAFEDLDTLGVAMKHRDDYFYVKTVYEKYFKVGVPMLVEAAA